MAGDSIEDIMVEKGLPFDTVDRINPHSYSSMMKEDHSSVRYDPDRVLREYSLHVRDSELSYVGIDLEGRKVCYYDKFGLPKIGYSEDDFDTSVVLDANDVAWVVDRVDKTSYYFSPDSNEFLPNYDPEIVDPADFISKIWGETKTRVRNGADFTDTLR